MRQLVIAIDCDDVLVRTTPFLVQAYNRKYGTNATLAQSHDPTFDIWQADEDEQVRRWESLTETEGYKDLGPDPEEALILRELAKNHELHLVTARKEHEREYTKQMLDRELAGVFSSMEFVGWNGSKGDICAHIGADVLIDDNYRHLKSAISKGLPTKGAILFGEYPWNESDRGSKELTYCVDWIEVKNVIDAIA